jgi:uncharacterized protein DUF5134
MFPSAALCVVFTLVFTVTGGYSLWRLARLLAGEGAPGDRVVELFHLVMSLGMIAMTWAWTGGPTSAGGVLQIVVFGASTVWFAYRAATRVTAHGHLANGYHLVMAAAMTWMVAAMPLMMGMSGGMEMSGHAGHHGSGEDMSGMAGMDHSAAAALAPGWVVGVSVVFVVLLLVAAGWWARRAVCADDPAPGQDVVSGGAVAIRTASALTVRADAGCHLLMSLGMAGMLVAMLSVF